MLVFSLYRVRNEVGNIIKENESIYNDLYFFHL